MIVVTGGCGFIGSNLVAGLNDLGLDDIVVVDDLGDAAKFDNIKGARITDYRDYRSFLNDLGRGRFDDVRAVFHQGACSDTMETDGQYMMRVNYEFSRDLLNYCTAAKIPFIYASSASVYGNGPHFVEDQDHEDALNIYAYSKLLFDRYVRRNLASIESQVVGLRYFNVYGPREQHKGRMASVAYHFYNQYRDGGTVKLFEGSGGYANGEQRRDFIYVEDAVDINLFFMQNPQLSGIVNAGTGNARSFNDVACAVLSSVAGQPRTTDELVQSGEIAYIPFPDQLAGKYQSFTEASVQALREIGYDKDFTSLETGVDRYVRWRESD